MMGEAVGSYWSLQIQCIITWRAGGWQKDEVARDQTWLALGVGVEVLAAVHRDVHLSFSLPRMYHLAEEINELILLPQSLYDSHALVLGRAATVETRTALGLTGWLWLALFRGNCRLLVGSRGLLGLLIVAGMV